MGANWMASIESQKHRRRRRSLWLGSSWISREQSTSAAPCPRGTSGQRPQYSLIYLHKPLDRLIERERKEKRTILFPIRLDKAVMDVEYGWPALVRNTRNIGNFVRWKQHEIYYKALFRLLNDLRASESAVRQIQKM